MMMMMVGCIIAEHLSNIQGHIEVVIMMMMMVGCIIAEHLSNIQGHIEVVIMVMVGWLYHCRTPQQHPRSY